MDEKEKELLYKLADQKFGQKDYKGAIEKLKDLPPDYKDVSTKLTEAFYLYGKQQLESGNCEQASELFQEAGNYKDVADLITQAKRCGKRPMWLIVGGVGILLFIILAGAFFILSAGNGEPTPTIASVAVVDTDTPTPTKPTSTSTSTSEPDTPPPTTEPTVESTQEATQEPTVEPTEEITQEPTQETTSEPTVEPTEDITQEPTTEPTLGPPIAPTNFQVTGVTETGLTLNWTTPTDSYIQIILHQDGEVIAELQPGSQSYTVDGLTCGQAFNFSIIIVNEAGPSEPAQLTTKTADCSAPPPPPTTPLKGKIAVPVYENGMYNIYLAEAKNNWTPKLLFDRASQPTFANNGRSIVVHSWGHKDWGQRLIYLTDYTDLTGFQNMTDFIEDVHPSFNKQGDEIVFHSRQESLARNPIIIIMGTYPGAPLNKLGEGTNPDWLGDRIIFYNSFPQEGLYVMDQAGGGDNTPILTTSKTVPAAAPDGDTVAVPLKQEHWQIFTFSVSQGDTSLTPLTSTNDADNYLPTWSPDGQHIAFASNRGGNWAVWAMNANGTDQRKLFDLPGSVDGTISDPDVNLDLSFGWFEERMAWGP